MPLLKRNHLWTPIISSSDIKSTGVSSQTSHPLELWGRDFGCLYARHLLIFYYRRLSRLIHLSLKLSAIVHGVSHVFYAYVFGTSWGRKEKPCACWNPLRKYLHDTIIFHPPEEMVRMINENWSSSLMGCSFLLSSEPMTWATTFNSQKFHKAILSLGDPQTKVDM